MTRLFSLFRGLRGKLILSYTLVTVLALLALEVFVLALGVMFSAVTNSDTQAYLGDVISHIYPQANKYLQPGQQDLPGLQTWLDGLYQSGYASLAPQYAFDSPAAVIVQSDPLYVLSPDQEVLALSPGGADLAGKRYEPALDSREQKIIEYALQGNASTLRLIADTAAGHYRMAVPVYQIDRDSPVVGVVVLTIKTPPPMLLQIWPTLLGWVVITGILLLMAVSPFGTLFGFIMSRGLTRRLRALTRAADAWSEGNFTTLPTDRANDEIGDLSRRMKHMAERIQNLLQSQQQLAMMEERNRLARELHDTVKQQSFAALMQLRAARNLITTDPAAAQNHLLEAEALVKTTQQELGLIIAELRPAALDGHGLAHALQEYTNTWSHHARIPATLNILNERALPLDIEQALYRIAQEALSNIARHSRASAVTVRLAYESQQVCLSVADNGVGFTPTNTGGYGLQSMKERLTAVRGSLHIETAPDQGTTLTATIPTS